MSATFGCWLDLPSAAVAEVLAHAGFDWLLIDMEHGPIGIETVMHCLMALKGTDTRGIVRVAEGTEAAIKRALDTGADGVMVPNVRSVDEARDLARFFHYAPHGTRGEARSVIRAAKWGRGGAEYARSWPVNHKLILQIETPEGLAAADEIAQVPGVDMLFLGPADFAASAGVAPDAVEVREAASELGRIAARHGLRAGSVLFPGTDVADLLARGMTDLSIAGDVGLINTAADKALAAAREVRDV
ncbi:HpcH/HpaI aldolase family protein [Pontivivens insulae]|uniref:2-dehydro-3,6-dideoxy-6-sulfogluconate aldolase n=1 Tax=Pontivivens insulae TaxID=1639689 RepID=A0A2R8AC11_9RHOB|nr:aldolase/citrate lyase family protein [Pontivivens insulae]RED11237.1 2,4-dihydroxyhept-2-enedioate aldolase [Pontivivens insulae]SPF29590.1 2-dehydro-3,6-dideoxy-6-sulfogluconate aldolase [Pontivivens insulae]